MSYPKRNPAPSGLSGIGAGSQVHGGSHYGAGSFVKSAIGNSSNVQKDERYVKRREQLLNLLVNKFRGKYISSVVSDESNVDRIIRTEVTRFLEREQMTEGNLVKLDQRLGELLENGGNKSSSG